MSSGTEVDLQEFLNSLHEAFAASSAPPHVMAFMDELYEKLAVPVAPSDIQPIKPDVLKHLSAALEPARQASPQLARLADAFEKIAPLLAWKGRASGGAHASENWRDGHANAMIAGQGGLREQPGIMIGATLMAPNVRYPDHNHAPEEAYIVLTEGRFQHGNDDWVTPGIGGTFHNIPSIKHAMASVDTPFLAIWSLIDR